MEPFPLDTLPEHHEWAAYLLDTRASNPPGDPAAYTKSEVYEELFSKLHESYREAPKGPIEARRATLDTDEDRRLVSRHEELYLATPDELHDLERDSIESALEPVLGGGETVFDLGCGWGYSLGVIASAFDVDVIGGEYTQAGVDLSRDLNADFDNVRVEQFDFGGDWDLVDAVDGEAVVFTKEAVTAYDDPAGVVEQFERLAQCGQVSAGVHLEQTGPHPETVLGYLRRAYNDTRGYNMALHSELEVAAGIEITAREYDVLGLNPLHPITLMRWEPV